MRGVPAVPSTHARRAGAHRDEASAGSRCSAVPAYSRARPGGGPESSAGLVRKFSRPAKSSSIKRDGMVEEIRRVPPKRLRDRRGGEVEAAGGRGDEPRAAPPSLDSRAGNWAVRCSGAGPSPTEAGGSRPASSGRHGSAESVGCDQTPLALSGPPRTRPSRAARSPGDQVRRPRLRLRDDAELLVRGRRAESLRPERRPDRRVLALRPARRPGRGAARESVRVAACALVCRRRQKTRAPPPPSVARARLALHQPRDERARGGGKPGGALVVVGAARAAFRRGRLIASSGRWPRQRVRDSANTGGRPRRQ